MRDIRRGAASHRLRLTRARFVTYYNCCGDFDVLSTCLRDLESKDHLVDCNM
jgi:hypothetical protein